MAWQDRIREAAYTSPSGTRISFNWESVSRATPKRTTAFEFTNVNGAYVQTRGYGARTYPLRCIFTGEDHDLVATSFEDALLEEGTGRLEHPFYGTFDVVPFGTITRRDDLKNAANQTIIETEFWTAIEELYPQSQIDPESEIRSTLGDFDSADGDALSASAAQQLEASLDVSTTVAQEGVKATVRSLISTIGSELDRVAAATDTVAREIEQAKSEVLLGIDVLAGKPVDLALSMQRLVAAPARAAATIQARLDAYESLAQSIFDSPAGRPGDAIGAGLDLPRRSVDVANSFRLADLVAISAVGGAVRAAIETEYQTKPRALEVAGDLLDQMDALVAWRDAAFADLGAVDTGATYQSLRTAVSLAAGFLVEVSFTLVPERRVVLDRARTIIDLCAELYGSIDDRLDFLIETNDLSGSEILELPRGKTIVYYA